MTKTRKILLSISGVVLVIIVALSFTWERILLKIGGIEPFRLESKESVVAYADAHGDKKGAIFIPSNLEHHKYLKHNFSTPGCIIFNRDSLPINSSHNTGCQWVAMSFLEKAGKDSNYAINTNGIEVRHLNDILQKVDCIKEDATHATAANDSSFDFIVVYAWAKYFPKSVDLSEALNNMSVKDKRIAFISLNLDYTDRWMNQDSVDKLNNEPIEFSVGKR